MREDFPRGHYPKVKWLILEEIGKERIETIPNGDFPNTFSSAIGRQASVEKHGIISNA